MRVLAALAALALAGCLVPTPAALETSASLAGLAEAVYDVLPVENVKLAAADGVDLDAWIWRPDVPEGQKVPVIIQASPYFGNLGPTPDKLRKAFLVEYFVPRGYAVVHHSVRGTGDSGGCFDFGGATEQQDLVQVVTHFGEAEWSNGNVALYGVSYDGTTPWQAAIHAPPHLKAIVPISGISDMYRYMFYDGAAYWLGGESGGGGATFPTYYYAYVDWGVGRGAVAPHTVQRFPESACEDVVQNVLKGYETGLDGEHDGFWDEREYEAQAGNVQAAVFYVHGLQDWNVKPDNGLRAFEELPGAKKAWLGQWEHNVPSRNTFNRDWSRDDWNATLQAWFDKHLLGRDVDTGPAVEVQDQLGTWRTETEWPPARAAPIVLHPQEGGRLAAEAPETESSASFRAMPATRPVYREPWPIQDMKFGDAVLFETAPLAQDLRVVGVPRVTLNVVRDMAGDGQLAVSLVDVDADGGWTELDRGFVNLRQWQGRDGSAEPPVGAEFTVEIAMYPQDLVFQAGHRVALLVGGAHADFLQPTAAPIGYTLRLGGDAPTRLELPVDPDLGFATEDAGEAADAAAPLLAKSATRG